MRVILVVCFLFTCIISCMSQGDLSFCNDEERYSNGKLSKKRSFNDGVCKVEEWYENGQYKSFYYEKEGIVIGLSSRYCENGQKICDFQYSKSDSVFEYKVYHCNGKLSALGTYVSSPGCLMGDYIEYYDNGNIKLKGTYKKVVNCEEANSKEGEWEYWNQDGTIEKKEKYSGGLLIKVN